MEYTLSQNTRFLFAEAERRVRAALQEEGFGVLTEIDVQDTFKRKLNVDGPAHKILGACNPPLAHRALQTEPDISALLPCNLTLRATSDGTRIAAVDPRTLVAVTGNHALDEIAEDVRRRLERVLERAAKQ